ncbi:hypothetical protein PQR37_15795 [Paraburkholderia nemoris]|jgi:hypothetical protein|uniref:hypothetical protein n=1 Tax=Paraburkholderia nemoris TaxID=2793076 RepID=UPI00190D2F3A|nr:MULTISPECIES: hypothetical protein [Paraburkholderia]MBK3739858.1 hypothetical protein [Paraburkholderia aspalathi]MBK3784737.1 hypothetical protein [Paraburkholderia aspalathi]MBK5149005.1 hypothetical protein [Burkholderia sp. R-69608]
MRVSHVIFAAGIALLAYPLWMPAARLFSIILLTADCADLLAFWFRVKCNGLSRVWRKAPGIGRRRERLLNLSGSLRP